jgi:hypothetical protein
MPETAQAGRSRILTSAPFRPGTESIVKFSEIFLLGSTNARSWAGWLDERDHFRAC